MVNFTINDRQLQVEEGRTILEVALDEGIKIPAAWLVENVRFNKGYRKGGVGISIKHSLALINCGGTAKELLDLSAKIENEVYKNFGIELKKEPEIIKM